MHLLEMVLAEYSNSYSPFVCHMMLTSILTLLKTQQHFQTIVQLTHTHPTLSCIHLVFVLF